MYILFPTTVALSFLSSFVYAQSNTTETALGIAAIEAHFKGALIVPGLLATFDPSAIMTVNFTGTGLISPGQNLTRAQVATAPLVGVTLANSSVSGTGNYTLLMVDAGAPGANETAGQHLHWLVNGVTINGSQLSTAKAEAIRPFAAPSPPTGSGPHRYVILLFPQPSNFVAPANFTTPSNGVTTFQLTNYIAAAHLSPAYAGMYFVVQVGATTVSVAPTSPVVSSTLKPETATAAASAASHSASSGQTKSSSVSMHNPGNSLVALVAAAASALVASYVCLCL